MMKNIARDKYGLIKLNYSRCNPKVYGKVDDMHWLFLLFFATFLICFNGGWGGESKIERDDHGWGDK